MDFYARTQRLWQHTCCQTRYWSAARLCDRCGTHGTSVVVGVSMADAMAHLHLLEQLPIEPEAAVSQRTTAHLRSHARMNPGQQVPLSEEPASEPRSSVAQKGPDCQRHEEDLPAPRSTVSFHPDLQRALVASLWLLSGLVCTSMAIGAFVEFDRANYVRSFTCAISAAAAPTSVIAFAIDGWLKHHRSKMQRV